MNNTKEKGATTPLRLAPKDALIILGAQIMDGAATSGNILDIEKLAGKNADGSPKPVTQLSPLTLLQAIADNRGLILGLATSSLEIYKRDSAFIDSVFRALRNNNVVLDYTLKSTFVKERNRKSRPRALDLFDTIYTQGLAAGKYKMNEENQRVAQFNKNLFDYRHDNRFDGIPRKHLVAGFGLKD